MDKSLSFEIEADEIEVFLEDVNEHLQAMETGILSLEQGNDPHVLNAVFRAGPDPQPCVAAGDVNCSGGISPGDIIHMVNFVFKDLDPPCDVCSMIPGVWACP